MAQNINNLQPQNNVGITNRVPDGTFPNLGFVYSNKSQTLADEIIEALAEYEPYIISKSISGVSIYIGFANLPKGMTHKLRISDHNKRSCYGYKWQLRRDGFGDIKTKRWSFYFDSVNTLVTRFQKYYDRIEPQFSLRKTIDNYAQSSKATRTQAYYFIEERCHEERNNHSN